MTVSVIGRVSAVKEMMLEVISAERGVETQRTRYRDGDHVSLSLSGQKTFVLREVPVGAAATAQRVIELACRVVEADGDEAQQVWYQDLRRAVQVYQSATRLDD